MIAILLLSLLSIQAGDSPAAGRSPRDLADSGAQRVLSRPANQGTANRPDSAVENNECQQCLHCTWGSDPDWETQGNGIGRVNKTIQSVASLCQLTRDWTTELSGDIQTLQPIIAGGYVLVTATDSVVCLNLTTGAREWAVGGLPHIAGDIRGTPTVDVTNGRVYVGGAAAHSFNCFDLISGAVIWSRNTTSTPLMYGTTVWSSPILSGGYVYFTQETGYVYKLDAATGTDATGSPLLLPDATTGRGPYNALTSDALKLWVGTANSIGTDGHIYQIDMASFTIDWELYNPSLLHTGDPISYQPEGFPGSMACEGGILYYHSLIADYAHDYDNFPQSGALGAIDVGVENGSGNGILWVSPPMERPIASPGTMPSSYGYSGPAISEAFVLTTASGYFDATSEGRGVAVFDKNLGTRIWRHGDTDIGSLGGDRILDDVRSDVPPTMLCQPLGEPYMFTSHMDGTWRLFDVVTGRVIWRMKFSGPLRGTAVAGDYVVTATRNGGPASGGGTVTAFMATADRPHLQIDSQYVFRNVGPSNWPITDDITAAIRNTGCVNLNITAYTGVPGVAARVSAVDPGLRRTAESETVALTGYDALLDGMTEKRAASRGWSETTRSRVSHVREFARAAHAAADPLFITGVYGPSLLAPGASTAIAITYEATGLSPISYYTNYIELTTDDPDYYPDDPSKSPTITVKLYVGCPDEAAYMPLPLGEDWIANHGALANGDGDGFHLNGNNWHFDGSLWAVATENTKWAIEGLAVGGPPRQPQEFAPLEPCGVTIADATSPNPLGGTDSYKTATSSIVDCASSNGFFPAGTRTLDGIILEIQRVGSQDSSYSDFSLARVKVTNEADGSGDLLDLYVGVAQDWDIGDYMQNNTELYVADGYYACNDGGAAGRGVSSAACGNARLDAQGVGTAAMTSGGAPTFMLGDFFGDQGIQEPFAIASDPYNYVANYHPGAQFQNTDVGVYYSMLYVPVLAEDSSAEFVYCTWQIDNGINGLPWSDASSFDAAVHEIVCRARAYAGFGKGDLNGDGTVDLADAVLLGNILDGLYDPTGTGGEYTADCDGSGVIDGADYDLLLDVVAGTQPASALVNGWRFH